MSAPTPEKLAELRRLLDATETPWALWDGYGPDGNGDMRVARIGHLSGSGIRADPDSADIYGMREAFELLASAVNALPALLDAAAERDALAEAVRAYGRTVDRWGLLIIAATHSEDITTPDGDGDWDVIESRLAEVPALLAERDALAAKLDAVRALHRPVGIYDECECSDEAKAEGHEDVEDIGLTCNRMYTVCAECCRDDVYQTEDCANYHDHEPDEAHHCPTIRALDGGAES